MPGETSQRVVIEQCRPVVDCGRLAAKATVGQGLEVSATMVLDGHDLLAAWVRHGPGDAIGEGAWEEVALSPDGADRYSAWIVPSRQGHWAFELIAIVDHYGSWLRDLRIRIEAGQEVALEFEEGARMVESQARLRGSSAGDLRTLHDLADQLRSRTPSSRRLEAAGQPEAVDLMRRTASRSAATTAGPFPLWVDRELAGFSAWYEFFPRSEGADDGRSGTFRTAARRLEAIASMGFDIVYLPPIHPIGTTFRKGPNNSLTAGPSDPGSPWAIGSSAGGHTAVHPDLGTLADFDAFVAEAQRLELEVALDYALQCSPDHPWVSEHPEWFRHRPDGTVRYAENPPKRYQDIYPLNFETQAREALWHALLDVLLFWTDRQVRVFRVDNPHTKAIPFWEWVIAEVHRRHPEVIFLAEAFTRPAVMHRLAKVGFTQSYTYFTWRNSKVELADYLTELSQSPSVDWFRPNFWVNTPDILHEVLQHGGPPAFRLRLVLAAMTCPSWGMYSGYELFENQAVRPGSEEYVDSEKFQLRPRRWDVPHTLAPMISRLNDIRRRHAGAIAQLRTLRVHHMTNDRLLCVSRAAVDRRDVLLVIVNLDPEAPQEGMTWLDLPALGIASDGSFEAYDELNDTGYIWQSPSNYVRLDPATTPAHVLRLTPR